MIDYHDVQVQMDKDSFQRIMENVYGITNPTEYIKAIKENIEKLKITIR